MVTNRKVIFKAYPDGKPTPDCFEMQEETIGEPGPDHLLIANEHLSIDAWITTTLRSGEGHHMATPLGSPVIALGIGRVVASGSDDFKQGDAVFGPLMAQTHMHAPAAMFTKVDDSEVPASSHLGALGLTTGLTAHVGLVAVGELQPTDTVVISAAAGSVGSFACEVARLRGARVIGIAGGPDKVRYLEDELGIAAGIDYKNEDVGARLTELAPDGIDLFFDNVGGEQLDLVLDRIAPRARVVICGAISQYPITDDVYGPKLYLRLAERNASMRGFTVDAWPEHHPEAIAEMTAWLKAGQLNVREHVVEGIENFPDALDMLFTGHIGKLLVRP